MVRRLAAAILLAAALPALAQVYKWKDAAGKVHYSSTPPPAAATSVQPVEERLTVTEGMSPEERAAAERRFATRKAEEEREWEERQRAQAAQQASNPPADDPRSHYRDPIYYDDFGGVVYPGPIRRPGARPPRVTHHQTPGTLPAPPPRTSSGGRAIER